MRVIIAAFAVLYVLPNAAANSADCQIITRLEENSIAFICTDVTNLAELDRAQSNTTSIEISNSKIPNIIGHTFARFGATLITLDLHESGIQTIDSLAFIGLTNLQNLILWGNKLQAVFQEWFMYTPNLRTLDISFNFIREIDYRVFGLLPRLENFYFDYNRITFLDYSMFSYLPSLKNVKFEKNPLQWGYRAHLIWQLQNQQVKYTEDWEDWGWMNVVIKECTESGQGEIPKDTVLDCIVGKLLDFTREIFSLNSKQLTASCNNEAAQLVRCMRSKNATGNTDNETVRKILENYVTVLLPMSRSRATFSTPINSWGL